MNAYDELMNDLAHVEPRHGYTRADIKLTAAQAAVVLQRYPDLLGEALAQDGAVEIIARLMGAMETADRFDLICAGIAAEVANRVRKRAPGWIYSDVINACDERRRCAALETV